jgi:hypothetical protein
VNQSKVLIIAVIAAVLAIIAGFAAYAGLFDDGSAETGWSIEPTEDLVYNGTSQQLVKVVVDEGTIYYSLDGTEFTTEIPSKTDAGKYTVWCKVDRDGEIIGESTIAVTIRPAPVIVKVDDCQKYHGEADPVFTAEVSGTLGSDKVTYTISREPGEDCGGYVISASGEEVQGNYKLTFENGYLVIFNEVVVVTPNDASKAYGSADPVLTATVEGGEGIEFTLVRESGERPGTYKIHAVGERAQGNYLVEFGTGIFTIEGSPETDPVTPVSPTDNSTTEAVQGLIYNGSPQALVRSTFTDETITYSLDGKNYSSTVPTGTDAGKYTVWYKVTKNSKTLTEKSITAYIEPKTVTVKANDVSKQFGNSDPTFTATVSGTLGSDKVKYTLSREQGEELGKYTISITANEVQGNYRLMILTGTLSIYKIVKVTPNDASKQFGTSDPVFTATVDGDANVSYLLTRDAGEDLGAYKIHATGERNQGNYVVEFDSGIFSIMATSASWATEPAAQSYDFDGWAKELITPGTVAEGIAYYRLSTENYSTDIPTATEPGIYKIFCKVSGGGSVADSTEIVLISEIRGYLWDGAETKEPRTVDGKYIIHLASELAWVAQNNFANGGFDGKTFEIGHDIDLRSYEWTPIGSVSSPMTCPFKGTVKGNNHVIENLVIHSGSDYVGLFGHMSGGHVENLAVDKISISGSRHVGTIAGFLDSTAEGLKVTHVDLDGNRYVGAIAGYQTKKISNSEVSYANVLCSRITISTPYALSDMGNDVGGISGMCNSDVDDCTVSHLTINGYRNVGGIAGNIQENTVTVKVSDCNLSRTTIIADLNGGNAGILVGRASDTTLMVNNSNLYTSIIYITTPSEQGGEGSGEDPITTPPNYLTGTYDKIVAEGDKVTIYKDNVATVLEDIHQIILDGVTINASENTPAIEIKSDAWLTIVIKNDVNLKGGKDADAIRVHESGEVTITGGGTLTVIGNNGQEYDSHEGYNKKGTSDYASTGGSGIGFAGKSATTGTIRVTNLSALYAYGYGGCAAGIGGSNGSVTITSSTIKEARGGFDEINFLTDGNGMSEAEGAPAIAGRTILIENSIIEKALGGSKSAGIGGRFWDSSDITIINSNLQNIVGGNGSAGIGGSHPAHNATTKPVIYISILIENSDVTVTGGYYGAGIGSGYDRCCGEQGSTDLTIVISSYSNITAEGGKYAADIGTGFHSGILKGSIDSTVKVHVTEGTVPKTSSGYSYTAQGIGYGVVDSSREGASLMNGSEPVTPSFTVSGVPITNPFDPARLDAVKAAYPA